MGGMSQRRDDATAHPASPRPGALVEPGDALSEDARQRSARQLALPGFGEEAQRRLAAARVLIVGAGGLGCASAPYLAGAGVGRIGIVDDDVVERSNLHRQVTHRTSDIGRAKVDALADVLAAQNPNVTVDRHRTRLTTENALALFRSYDLVLDGSDNFPTRYLTNDAAQLSGTPLVWGAILQYAGQVGVAWHAHGAGYRDLFPRPPRPGSVPGCAEGGVLPGLCGTIGSLMATEALKLLTGIGDPLIGRVLTYDALAARTRELRVNRDPHADPVTELTDTERFCGLGAADSAAPDAIAAEDAAELVRGGPAVHLLDVRSADEHAERRVRGTSLHSVHRIESGDLGGLPDPGEPLIVYCEKDPRSARAARELAAAGFVNVRYLRGGIDQLARIAPDLIERDA